MYMTVALTGSYDIRLPQWGRAFWQDENDGQLFLAFASGNFAPGNATHNLYFITSSNSGVTWTAPEFLSPVDDFSTHNNFDTMMDPRGHIHCGLRYQSSGCYQFLGKKVGGGWTRASGDTVQAPSPIAVAVDTSGLKGFNGSVSVTEIAGFDDAGWAPHARIVIRASGTNNMNMATFSYPYNSGVATVELIRNLNYGLEGGLGVLYWNSTNGLCAAFRNSLTPSSPLVQSSRRTSVGNWSNLNPASIGNVGYGPTYTMNMAFGSGFGGFDGIALVSSPTGAGMWGMMNSFNVSDPGMGGFSTSIYRPLQNYSRVVAETGIVGTKFFPWSYITPQNGIVGVGSGFPGSGTNVDFNFDDSGNFFLYIQKKDESFRQSIARVIISPADGVLTNTEIYHRPSGITYFATASKDATGGYNNQLFYTGFKACRHNWGPNTLNRKIERVMTAGNVAAFPSGGQLSVWNPQESVGLTSDLQIPYWNINYTATSGINKVFVGVSNLNAVDNVGRMFDNDPINTSGDILNTSTITMQLNNIYTIDRIEIVGQSTSSTNQINNIGRIDIFGSYDNNNYSFLGSIASGNAGTSDRLRSLTTNVNDVNVHRATFPNTAFYQIAPAAFCAKYIKLKFNTTDNFKKPITEIRLFGPASTIGQVVTADQSYSGAYSNQLTNTYMETFRRRQGEIPAGWRTYGDFTWSIVGSGEFVKDSQLPTVQNPPGYNGLVTSGVFNLLGSGNGYDDGFALRSEATADTAGLVGHLGPIPVSGIIAGNSGVVEVNVRVGPTEIVPSGSGILLPGRNLSFYVRMDPHGGDKLDFYTIGDFDPSPTGILRKSWTSLQDWEYNNFFLSSSGGFTNYKLRWIYTRGNTTNLFTLGAAWIDNVNGLDGPPISSIGGFVPADAPFTTGIINAYLKGNLNSHINAYLSAAPLSDTINAFVKAGVVPDMTSAINAYALGMNQSQINAYLLSTSGVTATTFPTGYIKGYVMVPSGSGPSKINGFVEGDWHQSIYGYLAGFANVSGYLAPSGNQIKGFINAIDAMSSINAVVNGGAVPIINAINGYISSQNGDQFIKAYVKVASGVLGNINGFTLGWLEGPAFFRDPQTMIDGYVLVMGSSTGNVINSYLLGNFPYSSIYGYLGNQALVPSGGGTIAGGPGGSSSTSNVTYGTNFIDGYLKGLFGDQFINGYVMATPGAYNNINAYVPAGASQNQINSYAKGALLASGIIKGWTSGVGFGNSDINGWLFAVSGFPNSQINSYTKADLDTTSYIWATLIAIPSGSFTNSKAACPAHNFPLPTIPTITIPPTSKFFN